jgi:hypothetical protein
VRHPANGAGIGTPASTRLRCEALAASPGEPASAAGCTLGLRDPSPSIHRQMDRQLLIATAGALASHDQMIAELIFRTRIFVALNEDFCA